MENYGRHAETLRRMAVQYQQMVEAADAFDTIANSDAMLTTLRRQADAAKEELARTQASVEKAKATLEQAKVSSTTMLRDADEQATAKVAAAEKSAAEWIQQAKDEAKRIVEAERGNVQAKLKSLQNEIATAQKTLERLTLEIAQSTRAAKDADDKAKQSQALLEKIQEQARRMVSM